MRGISWLGRVSFSTSTLLQGVSQLVRLPERAPDIKCVCTTCDTDMFCFGKYLRIHELFNFHMEGKPLVSSSEWASFLSDFERLEMCWERSVNLIAYRMVVVRFPGVTTQCGCIFTARQRTLASSFSRFLDHIQRHATIGMTSLDEWSIRRKDLYLTTHNTHNRQTSIPPVGFEPTISAGERPKT
jgi:hypothetical protein